jgi:hypothetical protein
MTAIMKSAPTPSDHEVLTGVVERVTYQNAENGFWSSPFRNHQGWITRHARYAIISPTRMPSRLRRIAVRFSLALIRLTHRFRLWISDRCFLGYLGRGFYRFRSGRHRLFQRYDSIPSNGLSDLCHG